MLFCSGFKSLLVKASTGLRKRGVDGEAWVLGEFNERRLCVVEYVVCRVLSILSCVHVHVDG